MVVITDYIIEPIWAYAMLKLIEGMESLHQNTKDKSFAPCTAKHNLIQYVVNGISFQTTKLFRTNCMSFSLLQYTLPKPSAFLFIYLFKFNSQFSTLSVAYPSSTVGWLEFRLPPQPWQGSQYRFSSWPFTCPSEKLLLLLHSRSSGPQGWGFCTRSLGGGENHPTARERQRETWVLSFWILCFCGNTVCETVRQIQDHTIQNLTFVLFYFNKTKLNWIKRGRGEHVCVRQGEREEG